jgi:cytidine deaminase
MTSAASVDWERLRSAASEVVARAYAPYSGLKVGAAGLVDDGRIIVGCNVENASYGLALCAECGLASALHASGGGRLVAISVVGEDGRHLAPCGRCRQVLWEVGGPSLLVDDHGGPIPLTALLPGAFGPGDLPEPGDPGA